MAYLTPTPVLHRALQTIRARIARATGLATTLGYGPRFLHSTGQLHKGGAGNGLFIQITGLDAKDLDVPGAAYGFSILKRAQALGDFEALGNHKLRAIRFDLSKNAAKDLARFAVSVK
jgi:transaldolase/glucose-6-phosphate isomerase